MPPPLAARRRGTAAVALLLLAAVAALAYRDVLFSGRTLTTAALVPGTAGMDGVHGHPGGRHGRPRVLDPGASGWQYEPWTYVLHDAIARGDSPLWNPHAAFGAPFAANGLSGAFTPLRWPLLAAPSPVAFDAYLLARPVLAAWLAFLLFRRLGLAFTAALAGGATFGYCGYFLLHVNMTHLDVEILLPLLLLAGDAAARSGGAGRPLALLALATALAALGGNPESLAVALLAAAAFAAARARFRPRPLLRIALAFLLGLALAAPLLLPEIEYVALAAHIHDASVGLTSQPKKTWLMALVPDFFGSIHNSWTPGNPQFRWIALGAVPWGLAIAGLAAGRRRRALALFFGSLVAIALMKVFGIEPAQSLGRLPVLDVIIFTKHLQPAIALGVGALAAIALDRIAREDAGRRAAAAGLATVAAVVALGALRFRAEAAAAGEEDSMVRAVIEQGALLGAAAGAALFLRGQRAAAALAAAVLFTLLAGVPGHRPLRSDPRAEPPYVAALREDAGGPFRVAGYDGVLHPNWASVFRIDDLRSLDALNVATSLAWVKARVEPLAADRFTGLESFSADLLSGAMDAANVRYLLSTSPLDDHATRLLARRLGAPLSAVGDRPAFRVAPGAPAEATLAVPRSGARLDARATTEGAPPPGGRPALRVELVADGAASEVAAAASGDRVRADLAGYAGRELRVRFTAADGAPVLVSEVDPALFGDKWESVPAPGAVRVFRNRDALPRAYVVRNAVAAASPEAALALAASAEFDVRAAAAVEAPPDEIFPPEEAAPLAAAPIVARSSSRVTVAVEGLGKGYLVLLDAFYPGWVARVDGVEAPIRRANGAFRAVAIGGAARRVEFRYEPLSFRAGLALAALGLAVTLVLLARRGAVRTPGPTAG